MGSWWGLAFPPSPPTPTTAAAAAALNRRRPKCQENSNALPPPSPPPCPIPHSFTLFLLPSDNFVCLFFRYSPGSNNGERYQVVPQLTPPLSSGAAAQEVAGTIEVEQTSK